MRIRTFACIAASFLSTVHAQDRAGNQIFQIPNGWTRSELSGSTILSPAAERPNYVVIILNGRTLGGDFREVFESDVRGFNGALRMVHAAPVQSRHLPEGVDLLATSVELRNPNGVPSLRYYAAASVGGRIESATFMAVSAPLFQRYWPAMQQFLSTWSFANLSAPAPAPSTSAPAAPSAGAVASNVPANRLEGVYSGYKFNYVTVLGVVQRKAVNDYFSFFPDGTVYWGLPQTGLVGFNPARACQGAPEFCGTYQVNGDQVNILLNRGTYRQVGTVTPGVLDIADRHYTLQGDISKSAARALDGTFFRADAQPGEDLARRFLRFTRDGHFIDQGLMTTVVSADISTGNPRFERPGGSGTYTLGPYTLILRYSDGYQRQLGVIVKPDDMDKSVLSQIFVNTYTLVLRR
jgi:hypothetical protein